MRGSYFPFASCAKLAATKEGEDGDEMTRFLIVATAMAASLGGRSVINAMLPLPDAEVAACLQQGTYMDRNTRQCAATPPPSCFNCSGPSNLPPDKSFAPVVEAKKKYCATHNAVACNLYVSKITKCPALATNAYAIILYELKMREHGVTARQAADLAVQSWERNAAVPMNPDDLDYIAGEAANIIATSGLISPDAFRDKILKRCIDAAAE